LTPFCGVVEAVSEMATSSKSSEDKKDEIMHFSRERFAGEMGLAREH